ncbi:MAG: methionyl-tRNA formyltransferase [Anaerolineales bacterium]|nr:methionyl-tRNA formyltransferase [Anaerolineales bacterium]
MTIRVVFMGSPDFALPSLRSLAKNYQVVGVVAQPDRASGRGRELKAPPVKTLAQELNIPVIQPQKLREPEAMDQMRTWKPDLIVVAAFGQILKKDVLDLPRYGCINVHASLLPRWRGAAPIQTAILAGDEETGVTIMKMDAGLEGSLFEALSTLGANLLIETLPAYIAGKIAPRPQPEAGVTYAPMLKKEDGRLDFETSVVELERRIRAMNPWPGAWMTVNNATLKIHRARAGQGKAAAGARFIEQNQPAVGAGGGVLILEEVQPAGKRPMSGRAFLSGAQNWESG